MAHQVFSSTTRLLALPEASLEYHTSKTPHWGDWPNDLFLSFSLFCFFNQASTRMGLSDHNDLSVNKLDILWGIALWSIAFSKKSNRFSSDSQVLLPFNTI